MKKKIDVYVKLSEGSTLPTYASEDAAGCDLYATEDMVIKPGEKKVMPLNFIVAIDDDIEIQIRPRSGLSIKTDIRIPNSPGTIDSDYRDTVGVILENVYNIANLPYQIAKTPSTLKTIEEEYSFITVADYIKKTGNEKNDISATAKNDDIKLLMNGKVIIDKNGNPYGTVYIKKSDRIAQMIFSECKRADFIEHDDTAEIGRNRGGGFGHSGISADKE